MDRNNEEPSTHYLKKIVDQKKKGQAPDSPSSTTNSDHDTGTRSSQNDIGWGEGGPSSSDL